MKGLHSESIGIKKLGSEPVDFMTNLFKRSLTFDPPSLTAGASATSSGITVTGAALGDRVEIFPPAYSTQGVQFSGFVDAADTVKIVSTNPTGGTIDLASGTFTIQVVRA